MSMITAGARVCVSPGEEGMVAGHGQGRGVRVDVMMSVISAASVAASVGLPVTSC